MRPSWDDVWMDVARVIARRSRCVRSQVGCVVVTPQNAIVSVGYNGPPARFHAPNLIVVDFDGLTRESLCDDWCPRATTGGGPAYYDDCVSSHAEMNAVVRGDRSAFEGGTVYVTRMPCYTCSKVIANSGVIRVVYDESVDDTNREPERSAEMMERSGVHVDRYGG